MGKLKSKYCGVETFTLRDWITSEETKDKTNEYGCSRCGKLCGIEEKEEKLNGQEKKE